MFLNISQNSQENTSVRVSFTGQACNFIKKETPTQMFSCEFCEIFKNTFFIEHLRWLLLYIMEYWSKTASASLPNFFLQPCARTGLQLMIYHEASSVSIPQSENFVNLKQISEFQTLDLD